MARGENGSWRDLNIWRRAATQSTMLTRLHLTAEVALALAGFKPGMTVLAPGIGGSVGKAMMLRGRRAIFLGNRMPAFQKCMM
jgi:hypothetical protein